MPAKKAIKKAKKSVKKVAKTKKPAKTKLGKTATATSKEPKLSLGSKPFNKTQTIRYLAAASGLAKKEILTVMDALADLITAHLKKRGLGQFTLLGLAKFKAVHKPATKAHSGINPFTGEPTVFAAKPARYLVKIRPLKKIKESLR